MPDIVPLRPRLTRAYEQCWSKPSNNSRRQRVTIKHAVLRLSKHSNAPCSKAPSWKNPSLIGAFVEQQLRCNSQQAMMLGERNTGGNYDSFGRTLRWTSVFLCSAWRPVAAVAVSGCDVRGYGIKCPFARFSAVGMNGTTTVRWPSPMSSQAARAETSPSYTTKHGQSRRERVP